MTGQSKWIEGEPTECDSSAWDRLPPIVRAREKQDMGTIKHGICATCGAAFLTEEWRFVLTAGNHLANILIKVIGPDFSERLPPDLDPQAALRLLHADQTFDVWVAWAAIMRARGTIPPNAQEQNMTVISDSTLADRVRSLANHIYRMDSGSGDASLLYEAANALEAKLPILQWQPINTCPESDDPMWFFNSATRSIEGPRGALGSDADKFDYWAPCEAPATFPQSPEEWI